MMKYKDDQKDKNELSLIDMREDYTYSAKITVEIEMLSKLINKCKEVIEFTKQIVHKN